MEYIVCLIVMYLIVHDSMKQTNKHAARLLRHRPTIYVHTHE